MRMAANRTTTGPGIIRPGDKTAVKINQVGIVAGGGTAQHRHPVGIVAEGTGGPEALHMTPVRGKIGKGAEQDAGIMAAETQGIIALGVAQGIGILFVAGCQ